MSKYKREELKVRAEDMRNNPTIDESIFIGRLKDWGIKYRFQVVLGKYIVDFIIGNYIIEVDGQSHYRTVDYDRQRDDFLSSKGYTVIRIPNYFVDRYDFEKLPPFKKKPKPIEVHHEVIKVVVFKDGKELPKFYQKYSDKKPLGIPNSKFRKLTKKVYRYKKFLNGKKISMKNNPQLKEGDKLELIYRFKNTTIKDPFK